MRSTGFLFFPRGEGCAYVEPPHIRMFGRYYGWICVICVYFNDFLKSTRILRFV